MEAQSLSLSTLTARWLHAELVEDFFSASALSLTGTSEEAPSSSSLNSNSNINLISAAGVVELEGGVSSLGALHLRARLLRLRARLASGPARLYLSFSECCANYGNIVTAGEVMFSGSGVLENSGSISAGDTLTLTRASPLCPLLLLNREGASLASRAGSVLGVDLNIHNAGLMSAKTELNVCPRMMI